MPLAWWNGRSSQLKCAFISLSIIGVLTVAYVSVNRYKNDDIVTEEPQIENVTFFNLTRSRRYSDNIDSHEKRISTEANISIEGIMINGKFFSGTVTLLGEAPKTTNVSCVLEDQKHLNTFKDKAYQFGIGFNGMAEITGIILNGVLFRGTISMYADGLKLNKISCILEYKAVLKIAAVELLDPLSGYHTESYGEEVDANPFYNFEVIPANETGKNQTDQKSWKTPAGETVTYPTTTVKVTNDSATVEMEENTESVKTITTTVEPKTVSVDNTGGSTTTMASVESEKSVQEPVQTTESNSDLDTNVTDLPDMQPNTLSHSTNQEAVSDQGSDAATESTDQNTPSEQGSTCYASNSSGMNDSDSESNPASFFNYTENASHTVDAESDASPLPPSSFRQNIHGISAAGSNRKSMQELLSSVRESLQLLENIASNSHIDDLSPIFGSGIMESKTGDVKYQGMSDFLNKEKIEDRNIMSQELSPLMAAMKTGFLELASNTNASKAMAEFAKKLNKSKVQFPPTDYVGTIHKISKHEDKKNDDEPNRYESHEENNGNWECHKRVCSAPQSMGNIMPKVVPLYQDAISVSSTDRLTKLENGQVISNAYAPKSGIAIPPETLESAWLNLPDQESSTAFKSGQIVENFIHKLFPALAAMGNIKSDDHITKLSGQKPAYFPFELPAILASLQMDDDDDSEEYFANKKRIRRKTNCYIQLINGQTKNVPCEEIGGSHFATNEDKLVTTNASSITSNDAEAVTTEETAGKKNDISSTTSEKMEAGMTKVAGTTSAGAYTDHEGTISSGTETSDMNKTKKMETGMTEVAGTTSAGGYTDHEDMSSSGTETSDMNETNEGTASPNVHSMTSNSGTSEAGKPDVGSTVSIVIGMTTTGTNNSSGNNNEMSTGMPSSKNATHRGKTSHPNRTHDETTWSTKSNESCDCDAEKRKSSTESEKSNCDDCDFHCDTANVDDSKEDDDFCDLLSCKKRFMKHELDSSEVTTASNMANSNIIRGLKRVKEKKRRDAEDIENKEIAHTWPLALSDMQSSMKDIKDIWGFFTNRVEQLEVPKLGNRFELSPGRFLRRNLFNEMSLDMGSQPFAHLFNGRGNGGVASNIPLDSPSLDGLLKKLSEVEDDYGTFQETCKGLDGKGNCKIQRVERKKVKGAEAGCTSKTPKEKNDDSSFLQESSEEKSTTTTSTDKVCLSTKGEGDSTSFGTESHSSNEPEEQTTHQDNSSDQPVTDCGNGQPKIDDCGRAKRNVRHKFRQIPVRKMFRSNLRADMDNHIMNGLMGMQSLIDSFDSIGDSGNIGSIPIEIPSLDDLFKDILSKFNDDSSNNVLHKEIRKGRHTDKTEEICNELRNSTALGIAQNGKPSEVARDCKPAEVAGDCKPSGMVYDCESSGVTQDGSKRPKSSTGMVSDGDKDQSSPQKIENHDNEPSSFEDTAQDCTVKKKSQSTKTSDRDRNQSAADNFQNDENQPPSVEGIAEDCKENMNQSSPQKIRNHENEPSSDEEIAQDCEGGKKSQSTPSDGDGNQSPSAEGFVKDCKEKKKSCERKCEEDYKLCGNKTTDLKMEDASTSPLNDTFGYSDENTHFSTNTESDHSTRTTFMNGNATETKSDEQRCWGKSNDGNFSCRAVIVSSTNSLNDVTQSSTESTGNTDVEVDDGVSEKNKMQNSNSTVYPKDEMESTESDDGVSTKNEMQNATSTVYLKDETKSTESDDGGSEKNKIQNTTSTVCPKDETESTEKDDWVSTKNEMQNETSTVYPKNEMKSTESDDRVSTKNGIPSDATGTVNPNNEVNFTALVDGISEKNEIHSNATTDETTTLDESQFTKTTMMENVTDNVCLNTNCILAAAQIIRIVDLKTNPCNDFHRFSCGRFLDDVSIPQYKIAVNQINLLNDRQLDRVKRLLNDRASLQDPVAVKEAKKFYNACLNEDTLNNELNSLTKLITSKMGSSWPVSSQVFKMDQYVEAVFQLGVDPNHFISFTVEPFNGEYLLHVSSAKLSLPSSVLVWGLESTTVNAYFEFMKNVAELLNVDAQVKEDFERILNFEVQLAKIVTSVEEFERSGLYYTKMKLVEAIKKYPDIDWNAITKTFIPEGASSIDSAAEIVFKYPRYMNELTELLEETSDRVQYSYAIWRIIAKIGLTVSPEISEKFRALFQGITNSFERLDGIFDGTTIVLEDRPRWVECIDATKRAYSVAVSYMYAQKYFDSRSKSKVENIALAIRNKIKDLVVSSKLMDEKTRNYAEDKIEAMEMCIGYDEKITDRKGVDSYYQGITMDHMKFLYWYQEINAFELKKKFSKLHLKSKHCDDLLALGDYARYRFESNDFIIAARFLQDPLFEVNRPDNMNFGGVGFAMAHFMLHSITFEGRYFDKTGANVSNGWWGQETLKNFISISQCLTEDYLRLKPSAVTSFKTINEFIVDVGAMDVVYQAYKKYIQLGPEPFKLPGLESYTEEQSFWLSFGSTLCAKTRMNPTTEIRLVLGIRNNREFGDDYRCPKDTKMNPKIKCSMWI